MPIVERVPASAAGVAVLALVVAIIATWLRPLAVERSSILIWMLAVLPFVLVAHFKAWPLIARILAGLMVVMAAAQLVLVQWLKMSSPDSLSLGFIVVAVVTFSFCFGLMSETRLNRQASTLYLAASDPLTGLHGADSLRYFLERCFAAASRGRPLAVVMFEMDGLRDYEDRYGAEAADKAIRNVADILDANTRSMDMSGRFGKDEFLALLPGGTTADAFTFAVRVRKAVECSAAFRPAGMTLSAGVAGHVAGMTKADDLLREARAVMLAAAEAGGNRVMRTSHPADREWAPESPSGRRERAVAGS